MQAQRFEAIIAELAHLAAAIEEVNRQPFDPGIDLARSVSGDVESANTEGQRLVLSPTQELAN
jgi:hypothetical protein